MGRTPQEGGGRGRVPAWLRVQGRGPLALLQPSRPRCLLPSELHSCLQLPLSRPLGTAAVFCPCPLPPCRPESLSTRPVTPSPGHTAAPASHSRQCLPRPQQPRRALLCCPDSWDQCLGPRPRQRPAAAFPRESPRRKRSLVPPAPQAQRLSLPPAPATLAPGAQPLPSSSGVITPSWSQVSHGFLPKATFALGACSDFFPFVMFALVFSTYVDFFCSLARPWESSCFRQFVSRVQTSRRFSRVRRPAAPPDG